jgi:hypothetical protein
VTRLSIFLVGVALIGMASPSSAQSDLAPRTAVSFVVGVGSATSSTGVAIGGSALFDMTNYAALEVQGTYIDRGAAASALNASASLLVNLVSSGKALVPYLAAGGGLYRASFELSDSRLLGSIGPQFSRGTIVCPTAGTGAGPGPGAGFGPGTGMCSVDNLGYWGVGQMNDFYARRLGALTIPAAGAWGSRSWTDPAVTLGGGVRLHVSDHFMVRPDARALVVFANGATHTVGVFGVNVGYRF